MTPRRISRIRSHLSRAALVGLVIPLALAGCGKKGAAGGPPGGMSVHVVGFKAARQPIEESVSLIGSLQANEAVEIMSELDGTVDEIGFEEGQPVTKGQLLVLIDQEKLRANLAEVEARLQLAESTMQRYTALAESNAVSRQEVEKAKAEHEATRASVTLMHAQLQDATITAPFDGVVGARKVSVGQLIMRGTAITSVIDTDPMKAEFRVPERHVAQLQPGQQIEMSVAAYPEETFTGKVYFIDPQIEESTRTVLVKALVPNPKGKLHAGMFANLKLVMQMRQDAVVIPETALMVQGEHTSVFVVDSSDTVQPRLVTPGIRLAGMVEIADGLRPGETVVVEGIQKLGPGAKVVVRFEDSSTVSLPGSIVPQAGR